MTLGYIVQRQRQTAVALGFAVQRPAGQILVCIRYCGEDYIVVTAYRQLAVRDFSVLAVYRCGDMAQTGRAERNIIGRNRFKCYIYRCFIGQIGNGVAVLLGCRSGDCGRAVSRRIPALDLITVLRLCRKDDGRAGRLLCAGVERIRAVRCGEVHRIRLADDLDPHIHADIVRYLMGKGRTGFTILLAAVHIPAFYLVAVIQTGNGKGDGTIGGRRGAAFKVGFRAAVRLELRRKLCLMRRSIRAVCLEAVGHLLAQRVKLNFNLLRSIYNVVCNGKRRLAAFRR